MLYHDIIISICYTIIIPGWSKPIWRQSGGPNPVNLALRPIRPICPMWHTGQSDQPILIWRTRLPLDYYPNWRERQSGTHTTLTMLNLAIHSIWQYGKSLNPVNLVANSIWQSGESTNPALNLVTASIWRCTATQSGKMPDPA